MKAPLAGALLGLGLAGGLLLPAAVAGGIPARGDLADFFWPMKAHTAARWAGGKVPLWNPLSACGEPWLAQLQTGVLYPGDVPFFLPGAAGPMVAIALHLAVAGAGMAAWLTALGRSRLAAVSGAAVYAGGGAFVSLVLVYNNFATAAYLPWVFLGAQRAAGGRGVATLGASLALAFLAGEPALAVAGGMAAALLAFAARREEPGLGGVLRGRAARRLAAGLLLAAGISAAAALPFAELVRETGRISNVTRGEALARPVSVSDLADLAVPPPAALTGGGTGRGGYLVTLALGPLALVLAAAGPAGLEDRRRFVAGLVALAGVGFLVALGDRGGLSGLLWETGLLRGLRFPARWIVFSHLALAVLAGCGVDGWRDGFFDGRRRLFAGATLALAAGLFAAGLLEPARRSGDGVARASVALAAALGGVVALARRRTGGAPSPPWTGRLLLAAVAVPLPWFAAAALAAVPAAELLAKPRIAEGLSAGGPGRAFVAVHDSHLLARFVGAAEDRRLVTSARRAHAALAGYGNLRVGLATTGTASPLENPRRARLLGAALDGGSAAILFGLADVRHVITPFATTIPGAVLAERADGVLRYALPSAAGRVLFVREARAASDDEVFEALRRPGFDPEAVGFVAAARGPLPPARARTGFSMARVRRDEPELLEIATSTSEPALAILTRSWDRGWRAAIDGREVPLLRADLAFQGVVVPSGEHVLLLTYAPASFRAGVLVSGLSLAVLAALVLAGRPPTPERR